MKVTLWGTRGSLPTPGTDTFAYGGNTSCIAVQGSDGTLLVLDAGTGIRGLGATLGGDLRRVDVLLSHLHMDHIQGLGFFAPLYRPGLAVHIWGPVSTTLSLRARLMRYLSPPLFPVGLRELPCELELHEEADIAHSQMGWEAVVRFAGELRMEDAVVEACRRNLIVWELYLNGIAAAGDASKSKRR